MDWRSRSHVLTLPGELRCAVLGFRALGIGYRVYRATPTPYTTRSLGVRGFGDSKVWGLIKSPGVGCPLVNAGRHVMEQIWGGRGGAWLGIGARQLVHHLRVSQGLLALGLYFKPYSPENISPGSPGEGAWLTTSHPSAGAAAP